MRTIRPSAALLLGLAASALAFGQTSATPAAETPSAFALSGATIHPVNADHGAAVADPHRFVPVLLEACSSVAGRTGLPAPLSLT